MPPPEPHLRLVPSDPAPPTRPTRPTAHSPSSPPPSETSSPSLLRDLCELRGKSSSVSSSPTSDISPDISPDIPRLLPPEEIPFSDSHTPALVNDLPERLGTKRSGPPLPPPSPSSFFTPSDDEAIEIIEAFLSPSESFNSIAERFDTTVQALNTWISRPETLARIDAIESLGARRVRAVAVNHLPACVDAMSRVISQYNWDEAHILYPYDSIRHNEQKRRNRETAVRATRLMLRLAHFAPGPRPPTHPTHPTHPTNPTSSPPRAPHPPTQPTPDLTPPNDPRPHQPGSSSSPTSEIAPPSPLHDLRAPCGENSSAFSSAPSDIQTPTSHIPPPFHIASLQSNLIARLYRINSCCHSRPHAQQIESLRQTLSPIRCANIQPRSPPQRPLSELRFRPFRRLTNIQHYLHDLHAGLLPASHPFPTPEELDALRDQLRPKLFRAVDPNFRKSSCHPPPASTLQSA